MSRFEGIPNRPKVMGTWEGMRPSVVAGYEMDYYSARKIALGYVEVEDEKHYLAAWQYLVNSGKFWCLDGWFCLTANALIEQGKITVEEQ